MFVVTLHEKLSLLPLKQPPKAKDLGVLREDGRNEGRERQKPREKGVRRLTPTR